MTNVAQPVQMSTAHLPLYVIHVDKEIVADIIGGELVAIQPGEVYEFPNRFYGRKFMEHQHHHGVVEVRITRDRSGIHFHIEEALANAEEALNKAHDQYIDDYVQTQYNDRMGHNRPPLPPSPRQRRVLKERGVNLEDYGIVPVGAKSRNERFMEQIAVQNQVLIQLLAGGKADPAVLERLRSMTAESDIEKPQPIVAPSPDAPKSDFVGMAPDVQVIPEARPGGEEIMHPEGADLDLDPANTLKVAAAQLGTTVEELEIADAVPGPAAPTPKRKR